MRTRLLLLFLSKMTNMYYMFGGAKAFNQPIGSWNVSNWRLCMWTSFRLFNPNCSHGTVIHFRGIHIGHRTYVGMDTLLFSVEFK